jgi:hypothetical protein
MLKRIGILSIAAAIALSLMVLPAVAEAADNAGKGMNREGSESVKLHGNDPGQDQGSEKNTADPDCRGNHSTSPQATNKGDCTTGADDKPGGIGGFNVDKDWNNGCGNDTDFEDDNNGWCGKKRNGGTNGGSTSTPPVTEVAGGSVTNTPAPSPVIEVLSAGGSLAPEPTEVLGVQFFRPLDPKSTAVLGEQLVRGQTMARTGVDSAALLLAAMFLTVMGMAFLRISKVRGSSAQ